VRTGEAVRARSRYFLGDGRERLVDLALYPVRDEDGVVTHIVATGSDVTEVALAQRSGRSTRNASRRCCAPMATPTVSTSCRRSRSPWSAETVRDLERVVPDDCLKVPLTAVPAVRDDETDRSAASATGLADTPVGWLSRR
jgi:hypothetical protein